MDVPQRLQRYLQSDGSNESRALDLLRVDLAHCRNAEDKTNALSHALDWCVPRHFELFKAILTRHPLDYPTLFTRLVSNGWPEEFLAHLRTFNIAGWSKKLHIMHLGFPDTVLRELEATGESLEGHRLMESVIQVIRQTQTSWTIYEDEIILIAKGDPEYAPDSLLDYYDAGLWSVVARLIEEGIPTHHLEQDFQGRLEAIEQLKPKTVRRSRWELVSQ